jgi:uncharacterized protein with PhoU and TrkA domain
LRNRKDAAEQQIQALGEDLNQRIDQVVQMTRMFLLLTVRKIHDMDQTMWVTQVQLTKSISCHSDEAPLIY